MSSTQVTEGSKSLSLHISVIQAKVYGKSSKEESLRIRLSLGGQAWQSSSVKRKGNSIKWQEAHCFEVNDINCAEVVLVKVPFILSSIEIGRGSFKLANEPSKAIEWVALQKNGENVGKVLINYLAEEKTENCYYSLLIHRIELEKEQVRFFKAKYQKKLKALKAEKKHFRLNSEVFLKKLNKIEQSFRAADRSKTINLKGCRRVKSDIRIQDRVLSVGYIQCEPIPDLRIPYQTCN